MKDYLFDKAFLKKLDYHREKETYIRIISLTNDEYPREQIEGKATGGSINVDGASAVRRSCSLSLIALEDDVILTDNFWCYNKKCNGLKIKEVEMTEHLGYKPEGINERGDFSKVGF